MSRIVKEAKCIREVFDSQKCILYRPGDIDDIDLDSDIALCFQLLPEDRKYALDLAKKRTDERKKELAEMKKGEFANLYEFRQYKKMVAENEATEKEEASAAG